MLVKVQNIGQSRLMITDVTPPLVILAGDTSPWVSMSPFIQGLLALNPPLLSLVAEDTSDTKAPIPVSTPLELNPLHLDNAGQARPFKALVPDADGMIDLLGLSTQQILVINATGTDMPAGALVNFLSFNAPAGGVTVRYAVASDSARAASAALLTAIANGATGPAVLFGTVKNLNTSGASVGQDVFLSATAGQWTVTAPSAAGQFAQRVGIVTKRHATAGSIYFFPVVKDIVALGTANLQSNVAANIAAAATALQPGGSALVHCAGDAPTAAEYNAVIDALNTKLGLTTS